MSPRARFWNPVWARCSRVGLGVSREVMGGVMTNLEGVLREQLAVQHVFDSQLTLESGHARPAALAQQVDHIIG